MYVCIYIYRLYTYNKTSANSCKIFHFQRGKGSKVKDNFFFFFCSFIENYNLFFFFALSNNFFFLFRCSRSSNQSTILPSFKTSSNKKKKKKYTSIEKNEGSLEIPDTIVPDTTTLISKWSDPSISTIYIYRERESSSWKLRKICTVKPSSYL